MISYLVLALVYYNTFEAFPPRSDVNFEVDSV